MGALLSVSATSTPRAAASGEVAASARQGTVRSARRWRRPRGDWQGGAVGGTRPSEAGGITAMGLFRRRRTVEDEPYDPDERSPQLGLRNKDLALLGQLMAAGADLSLPRHTRYVLYFSSADATSLAGDVAGEAGWQTSVHDPCRTTRARGGWSASGPTWCSSPTSSGRPTTSSRASPTASPATTTAGRPRSEPARMPARFPVVPRRRVAVAWAGPRQRADGSTRWPTPTTYAGSRSPCPSVVEIDSDGFDFRVGRQGLRVVLPGARAGGPRGDPHRRRGALRGRRGGEAGAAARRAGRCSSPRRATTAGRW